MILAEGRYPPEMYISEETKGEGSMTHPIDRMSPNNSNGEDPTLGEEKFNFGKTAP